MGAALPLLLAATSGQEPGSDLELPTPLPVAGAEAASSDQMRPYTEGLGESGIGFDMVPLPGGTFLMGSPAGEAGRREDEGPRHAATVSPFWIGRLEVSWDEYHLFMLDLDRRGHQAASSPRDRRADAVTRPTPPYVPMDFGMGVEGHPATGMTQFAARQYTRWLSMKTGRFYRLPTETEWEYACRAGATRTPSISCSGSVDAELDELAWYRDNSRGRYHPVGTKRPNRWGLHDLHGNVAEWVLDEYRSTGYAPPAEPLVDPVSWPTRLYPRVVRGGSWRDGPQELRCAARRGSSPDWKRLDPQLPRSIWYHTNADFVGFRVVRPLIDPGPGPRRRAWEPDVDAVRDALAEQRSQSR